MTKKKIRYSDFPAPPTPAAADAVPVASDEMPRAPKAARSARAKAPPVAGAAPELVDAPAGPEVARAPERPRAPLDLARALAAARDAEAAAAGIAAARTAAAVSPVTPASPSPAPRVTAARLTPMRGSPVVSRPTPVRGSVAVARHPAPAATAAAAARVAGASPGGAPPLRDRARLRTGQVDLLLFSIGREWFGVELALVEEAIDLSTIRHVPEMPPAMLGVITVRGALTSVYSPASALGVSLDAPSSALVFRRERGRLGIAVDDVDDVHTLDLAQLRDAPATDTSDGILLGVLRHRDTLLALVDAEALIAACQTVPALETA